MATSYPTPCVSTMAWFGCFDSNVPRRCAIIAGIVRQADTTKSLPKAARRSDSAEGINLFLTFSSSFTDNIFRMPEPPLNIEERAGSREGTEIWHLSGPLTLTNVFGFQSKLRVDARSALILGFDHVPWADSAGIGAMVGAYVTRQKDGRSLALVAVN